MQKEHITKILFSAQLLGRCYMPQKNKNFILFDVFHLNVKILERQLIFLLNAKHAYSAKQLTPMISYF